MLNLEAAAGALVLVTIAYLTLANSCQVAMGIIASHRLWRYLRGRTVRNLALPRRLASPPMISVIMPAYNEGVTIVQSVRAVLALEYQPLEIVVVNDGSSDHTLAVLERTFHLLPAPLAFPQPLPSAPLRGIYRSSDAPALLVIDKQNGGCKADAANAGINASSGAFVLIIDADTILEPDSLGRASMKVLEDPTTIAVGGYVAIANGCRIENGKVLDASMPRNWFARFQVVEYMRSFFLFRAASAWGNGVSLISGAFGLFRRAAVIDAGGYDVHAIGEDMDLTLRLHALFRARGEPATIAFVPFLVCWTQAPEDVASLRAQRTRWRRGLLQVLWRHRSMIGNPRYGFVGGVVLPYTAIIEGLGPLLESTGYATATVAMVVGLLNWYHYGVLWAVSILFGAAVTLLAVLLNDVATRRYQRGRDLALLIAIAVIENAGYRQLNAWWGVVGTLQAALGRGGWGPMKRRAFNE